LKSEKEYKPPDSEKSTQITHFSCYLVPSSFPDRTWHKEEVFALPDLSVVGDLLGVISCLPWSAREMSADEKGGKGGRVSWRWASVNLTPLWREEIMRYQMFALAAPAGLLSVLMLGATAHGGDLFCPRFKSCDAGCNTQTIKLPPQQITVESVQPKVAVRDTRLTVGQAIAVPPVVATIFTPLQLGVGTTETKTETRSALLTSYHEAEHHLLAVAQARAAQKAELDAADRVHKRLLSSLQDSTDDSCKKPAQDKNCADADKIAAQLQQINARLTELEKNMIVHDVLLNKLYEKPANQPTPAPSK
jgi:hypothetical protein